MRTWASLNAERFNYTVIKSLLTFTYQVPSQAKHLDQHLAESKSCTCKCLLKLCLQQQEQKKTIHLLHTELTTFSIVYTRALNMKDGSPEKIVLMAKYANNLGV